MPHIPYRRMLDRGRKAGLTASELYRALASRRTPGDEPIGRPDSNGYVPRVDQNGNRTYQPPKAR
jgi:hypothetical protein